MLLLCRVMMSQYCIISQGKGSQVSKQCTSVHNSKGEKDGRKVEPSLQWSWYEDKKTQPNLLTRHWNHTRGVLYCNMSTITINGQDTNEMRQLPNEGSFGHVRQQFKVSKDVWNRTRKRHSRRSWNWYIDTKEFPKNTHTVLKEPLGLPCGSGFVLPFPPLRQPCCLPHCQSHHCSLKSQTCVSLTKRAGEVGHGEL